MDYEIRGTGGHGSHVVEFVGGPVDGQIRALPSLASTHEVLERRGAGLRAIILVHEYRLSRTPRGEPHYVHAACFPRPERHG